ncbi:hypothetical protein GCM10010869_01170 [Mesorhizobium tianshanense]|uniref:hypothetical protein n=1 Tax=Mesorhizobium tianshanense TaxID=39844 RepID=UPI0011A583DB|nr:hypothetical protein [Mesorhizobium tianshanense]GLS34529.1 hypothetical protein GCM10010869_01170 [Mesorhizobium tianshanense]
MLGRLISGLKGRKGRNFHHYSVNMGMLQPKIEQLQRLEVVRRVPMQGYPNGADVWHLTFISCEFKFAINTSSHVIDPDPFGVSRVIAVVGRSIPSDEDFAQLSDRFWFRQIDEIRGIMRDIDRQYPGQDIG